MNQRRPELDGLRGLAALIVLVAHISNEVGLWNSLLGHGTGKVGLMIFFCLSGYLMGALYLNRKPSGQEIVRYALHRASRIMPLYFVLVFASFACGMILTDSPLYPVDSNNLAKHLIFIRATGVLWTIPVEVQFYVAFVGLWLIQSWSRLAFVISCAILIPCLWLVSDDMRRIGSSLLAWGPYFLTGLLVSCAPEPPQRSRASDWFWSLAFVAATGSALLLFPQIALEAGGAEFADNVRLKPWHNRWSYVAAGLLVLTTIRAPIARALLGNPAMVYVGVISYSVYLLHMPVIRLLKRFTPLEHMPAAFLLVAVLATGLAASASYFLFEDPVRRRLNQATRFISKNAPLEKRPA